MSGVFGMPRFYVYPFEMPAPPLVSRLFRKGTQGPVDSPGWTQSG